MAPLFNVLVHKGTRGICKITCMYKRSLVYNIFSQEQAELNSVPKPEKHLKGASHWQALTLHTNFRLGFVRDQHCSLLRTPQHGIVKTIRI
jgi:hypothetical protein